MRCGPMDRRAGTRVRGTRGEHHPARPAPSEVAQAHEAAAVALDVSAAQLRAAARIDARSGTAVPAVLGDAGALPFGDGSFDLACSAYGALQFAGDPALVHREVARVLRPGGRWVFSV